MIQIDLKLFDKIEDLTLPEYLVLCVIYEDLDYFNCITDNKTINIALDLEIKGYIRIIDCNIILDSKAIQLFESNPLVKQAKEILEHMNELKKSISKKPFSYNTHGKDILVRLSEKHATVQEIKDMLTYIYKARIGTEWQKFLRPATIFNKTKFYNYLEEAEIGKNKVNNSIHELV